MSVQRLEDAVQLPSFRSKWKGLSTEIRTLIRHAFAELQRSPMMAKHASGSIRLRTWLVEIHMVLIGYVMFTFCEVAATGAIIVVDALVLPGIDAIA